MGTKSAERRCVGFPKVRSFVRRRSLGQGRDLPMELDRPVRLGGLAALLAGVLLVISELLRLYIALSDPDLYRSIFLFDGVSGLLLAVLVQLGLVGLYARQA